MSYKIRRAKSLKDRLDIRRLHEECFGDEAPHVDYEDGWWWLVFDGKRPIGFAGLYPSEQINDGGYLVRAGVLPWHRGHGLHRRLIRVREKLAKKVGMWVLVTDTTRAMASSNNLAREGYKLYEPKHPWSLKAAIYWRKEI